MVYIYRYYIYINIYLCIKYIYNIYITAPSTVVFILKIILTFLLLLLSLLSLFLLLLLLLFIYSLFNWFVYLFIYLFIYLLIINYLFFILYLSQWQQNIRHLIFHFLFNFLCTCVHSNFVNHYPSFLISVFHPSVGGEFKTLSSSRMVYNYPSIAWVSRLR